MKILRLVNSIITTATANKYIDPKSGKQYFNLTHGVKGPATWKWYAGVSPKYFPEEVDSIIFDNDNYGLIPVYRNNKLLADTKGNLCYNIITDNDPSNESDILLLWTIPTRTYKDIKYNISGSVDLLGEGSHGRSRGPNSVSTPAPVLEIYGDCQLRWSGLSSEDGEIEQIISYDYASSKWAIGAITTVEVSNV